MNIKIRQKLVLAALLHDIGKFWERADNSWKRSEVIRNEFPNGEFGHVVPMYPDGTPKYTHALWTQAFVNMFSLEKDLGIADNIGGSLANLAANHHKPENYLEGIIALADKWSSAIDRPDEGEEDVSGYREVKNKWGTGFSKKVPLASIFDQIQTGENHTKSEREHSFNLAILNVFDEESVYPKITNVDNPNSQDKYRKLWDAFLVEFKSLLKLNKDFNTFYMGLDNLLRKFTWCIPSATNVAPANVSLYQHLKTTAGLALSIYDFYEFNNKKIEVDGGKLDIKCYEEDMLLMVCVDISGIQKFIYDIANKKAAKSLKGRSFYLQLLMNNVINRVLSHSDIQGYYSNVVYASGGKAYLILPNLDRVKKAINEIDLTFQDYTWNEFQGKIYVVFGHVAFNYQTFRDATSGKFVNYVDSKDLNPKEKSLLNLTEGDKFDLGQLWRIVSDRAAAKKNQKYMAKVLEFGKLFKPSGYDEKQEKCQVTGIRGQNLKDLNDGRDQEDPIMVLKSVYDQTRLGDSLKDGIYLIDYKNAEHSIKEDIQILDRKYQVKDRDYLLNKLHVSNYENAIVHVFNQSENTLPLNNTAVLTSFYGGNKQPENQEGKAKTFEELALTDDGKNTKLAVLRMDVDNLGQIFINGFDDKVQKKSFAAYATLSFMLDMFFSGHINYIHQQSDKKYKDFVQILYSGGDDLFAVGRWDVVIDFASEIRFRFEKFVGRPDITISGGVAIVRPKYPIMKSAEIAGEMEKAAKSHNGKSKNAFNFFGETVGWGEEFDFVKDMMLSFVHFDGIISRALLQNLQNYKLRKDAAIKRGTKDFSYIWHSAYSISRTLERIKKDNHPTEWEFVDSIRKNIIHNKDFGSERYLDLVALAARWAEYILKLKN